MNKTDIESFDYTYNPITGCWHECEYCYARGIIKRLGKTTNERIPGEEWTSVNCCINGVSHNQQIATLNQKPDFDKFGMWPFGFLPTYHKYRLDEPRRKRGHKRIFVGSMSDMWGDWVPSEWIEDVLLACKENANHSYFFLTKNPKGYLRDFKTCLPKGKNFWYGASITRQEDVDSFADLPIDACRFISIEPILERIDLDKRKAKARIPFVDWVLIGAETGGRDDKVVPEAEWIDSIVDYCHKYQIPVFMKNSLKNIETKAFVQCWPEGVGL